MTPLAGEAGHFKAVVRGLRADNGPRPEAASLRPLCVGRQGGKGNYPPMICYRVAIAAKSLSETFRISALNSLSDMAASALASMGWGASPPDVPERLW